MFKIDQITQLKTPEEIRHLSWEDFEWFCRHLLTHMGYERVSRTSKGEYGSDGGIDIACYKDGEKYLVQCKQWTHGSHGFLPVRVILEHAGCMQLHPGIKHGIVMTMLELSTMAQEDAAKLGITLMGKNEIAQVVHKISPTFRIS